MPCTVSWLLNILDKLSLGKIIFQDIWKNSHLSHHFSFQNIFNFGVLSKSASWIFLNVYFFYWRFLLFLAIGLGALNHHGWCSHSNGKIQEFRYNDTQRTYMMTQTIDLPVNFLNFRTVAFWWFFRLQKVYVCIYVCGCGCVSPNDLGIPGMVLST